MLFAVGWTIRDKDHIKSSQIDIVDSSGNLCIRLRGESGDGYIEVYRPNKNGKPELVANLESGSGGAALILWGKDFPETLNIDGDGQLMKYSRAGECTSWLSIAKTIYARAYNSKGTQVDGVALSGGKWRTMEWHRPTPDLGP